MECPICCDLITSRNFIKTKCEHIFHRECLETWLDKSSTCPCCRNNVHIRNIPKQMFRFAKQLVSAFKECNQQMVRRQMGA